MSREILKPKKNCSESLENKKLGKVLTAGSNDEKSKVWRILRLPKILNLKKTVNLNEQY